MKIALCSTFVPFVLGGYRNIVDWLEIVLQDYGHQVEKVYLPQIDSPDTLFQQMMAFRWIDLEAADRLICFRPQSHLVPHPHKILWFIHHLRSYYDLWDTPYRGSPDTQKIQGFRQALHDVDNRALHEAKKIYTNSKVVSDRLSRYNRVQSEVLYPPLFQPERYRCNDPKDEIVYICRIEHHKRQHLVIEAMAHVKSPLKIRLCGASSSHEYVNNLLALIKQHKLHDRVILENRWIHEEEKVRYFSNCLAAFYLPLDEDSYGYPTLEASHSSKPILTTRDSGGVTELIEHGFNGFVSDPEPKAIAEAMDRLYADRKCAEKMGKNAYERVKTLKITWDNVIEKLLQ